MNKNIHILPAYKPSRLYKNTELGFMLLAPIGHETGVYNGSNQHIYITSDEEIKEGDISFYPPFGVGKNKIIDGELCFHIEKNNGKGSFTQITSQSLDRNKKIILTTDQDLIADGVQAIDDEFLEWFVKNPSCEFVEVYISYRVKSGTIQEHKDGLAGYEYFEYKIIIPKEKPKQETLEEAAKKYKDLRLPDDLYDAFIAGAKWQAERMYSEEEVKAIWKAGQEYWKTSGSSITFEELIEQFKKK